MADPAATPNTVTHNEIMAAIARSVQGLRAGVKDDATKASREEVIRHAGPLQQRIKALEANASKGGGASAVVPGASKSEEGVITWRPDEGTTIVFYPDGRIE